MNISDEVLAEYDELVSVRRHFHANPELSFAEYETSKFIAEKLREIGVSDVKEGIAKTGVVGYVRCSGGDYAREGVRKVVVALRADMDALPLQETNDVPYKSKRDGVMHACGHDLHCSALLTTAKLLVKSTDTFNCDVKLIFQPAEEGQNGAGVMIAEGVLEDVDAIYGIHVWSEGRVGEVMVSDGPVMASCDRFDISVRGKGGHAAAPHQTVDAIVSAANIVTNLQTIVSRNVAPTEAGVVTCGTINGGYNFNIIAEEVKISGTTRAFQPEIRDKIKERIRAICTCCASMGGGEAQVEFSQGMPPTVNRYPSSVLCVKRAAACVVGEENITKQLTMGAEDFSRFLDLKQGCFFFVGCAMEGEFRPHHKSVFDADERAMLVQVEMFLKVVRDLGNVVIH